VEFTLRERSGRIEAGLGKKNELAEIAEGGGAAVGDAIGGDSFEDTFEGAVDVEAAVLFGEELREFGGEVFFDGRARFVDFSVGAGIVANRGGQ